MMAKPSLLTRARVLFLKHGLFVKAFTACISLAYIAYRTTRRPAGAATSTADDKPPCDVLTNPAWAPRLSTLRELSLAGCGLTALPEAIGACVSLEKLDLARNDLVDLPRSVAELDRLEILFILGSRRMTRVPAVLAKVPSLTRLGLRSNGLLALEGARLPPNLVHVIFTDNAIAAIDDAAYAKFGTVRKLMLANNRLVEFTGGKKPAKNLAALELLRLANNDLAALPAAVLSLPSLAWIALAGNARLLGAPPVDAAAAPAISLADVDVAGAEVLGRGASGEVSAVTWRGAPGALKRLALKSSDGRAEDELGVHAALGGAAAQPASLIRALAVVRDPPAVLMERLPAGARDLARPPTIVEVTRDRYAPGERFSADFALNVAVSVARAVAYLHDRGVAHGDVYGHNTLVHDASRLVKLGDFGASFFYGHVEKERRDLFAKVEARALGVLIAELGTRVVGDAATKRELLAVADAALAPDVAARATPAAVLAALLALEAGP